MSKIWTPEGIDLHNARVLAGRLRKPLPDAPKASNSLPALDLPSFDGLEKDIHAKIIEECGKRGWYFIHSRTDKRTTQAIGTPDFVIATFTAVWFIEVKRKGTKPTREQAAIGIFLKHLGKNHAVVYSVEEFLSIVGEK